MAMRKANSLLKYALIPIICLVVIVMACSRDGSNKSTSETTKPNQPTKMGNKASVDSAAESLDTLTAELSNTTQQLAEVKKNDQQLRKQNADLEKKAEGADDLKTASLTQELEQVKNQVAGLTSKSSDYAINSANGNQPIAVVNDLSENSSPDKNSPFALLAGNSGINAVSNSSATANAQQNAKAIPYYTIPSNATAVCNQLETALVGRIPVKGVVTDPYPFKIVFSDDTLAANGLRVPNLRQMIVSGYSEGDLNLLSVRGWVTSLTFVFQDGRIYTATSNNNDLGHFTKENALGYLSDQFGNPFIRGKLITNAPSYLAGNIALGAAQGAASAYAQSQTTSQSSLVGTMSSTVTGSPGKYVAGQAVVSAAGQAQQWWHDREEESFDAIYIESGKEIVVNFAKEIPIDYNPTGRKIAYENPNNITVRRHLD